MLALQLTETSPSAGTQGKPVISELLQGELAPQIVPELRLLTLAARPGYPGCTARRWSWLRVWEAIRQTRAYKMPRKHSKRPVRKLRFNTLLHPRKKAKLLDCWETRCSHGALPRGWLPQLVFDPWRETSSAKSKPKATIIYWHGCFHRG